MMLITGINLPIYSYADSIPSGYSPVTNDRDFAEGFNAYCKSRDAQFTSTNMGATYTYIYNKMKEGASYLGYDIDEMQEHLYATYTSGGEISKFYWDSTSIGFANSLFAWLINENDLEVGDTYNDIVYSGESFTDADGFTCLIFKASQSFDYTGTTEQSVQNIVSQYNLVYGTALRYDTNGLRTIAQPGQNTIVEHLTSSNSANLIFVKNSDNDLRFYQSSGFNFRSLYTNDITVNQRRVNGFGYPVVYKLNSGQYIYGYYTQSSLLYNNNTSYTVKLVEIKKFTPDQTNNVESANIYFIANVINNNVYEGDTVINNEGDVVIDTPPGGTPPDWDLGGGQGTADDGNGNTWNITWPSFELPDLNIDWSINGLSEKFPFSIPFDIYNLFVILDHEPETPEISGQIDLGLYQWNIDWDLHQFDDTASLLRNIEFIGFVLGLILITRSIIRG